MPRTVWQLEHARTKTSCAGASRRQRRLPHVSQPGRDSRAGGKRDHADAHLGVLEAAEFRALADIDAGVVGLQPGRVPLPGDQSIFGPELGNPEIVDHVGGGELQAHGHARGHDQFIGGGEDVRRGARRR